MAEDKDIIEVVPDTNLTTSDDVLMFDHARELDGALNDMKGSAQAFVLDGDRLENDHASGEPVRRPFTMGDDDPRDVNLCERVEDEDVVFTGRIFNVDRLKVKAALGRVTVEIPAGKLDPGEDPMDCAVRELHEETGMRADNMAFLTTIATGVGFCDELIHIYMATGLSFDRSDPDADEFINVDLVALPEFIDAVLDGKVEDAKTIVGALICDSVAHRLAPQE